jgi:hypothetical protein
MEELVNRHHVITIILFAAISLPVLSEDVELEVIHRIKQEAFEGSQVMDHLFWMTDVNGPRLSNSPGYQSGAEWAVKTMRGWGMKNAALEPWGEFGRGWSLDHFEVHLVEPDYASLSGIPLAWSGSTNGPASGPLVYAPLLEKWELHKWFDLDDRKEAIADFIEKHKGKLKGKIVLISPGIDFEPPITPDSRRYDGERLGEIAEAPTPTKAPEYAWPDYEVPKDPKEQRAWFANAPLEIRADYWARGGKVMTELSRFMRDEGALATLTTDRRGSGAILFAEEVGPMWEADAPIPPPAIVMQPEQYSRLVRLVQREIPTRVELDVRATFNDEDLQGYNVVAEIPGGSKKDEVVIVGGHFDSWHAGTGAADNASGCAVAMEAARILTALDLKMDRTVRVVLWGGEEQGLFGSRGYVRKHYGDPITMKLKPEHGTLSGYFNLDNGTGKIRGVYLQENDMMRPIFQAWLGPFADLGATTISIRNTGGTDHLSFDAVGLPGFQFIQDPHDYNSRTHHSDLDVYDHIVPEDMMQASAIMAAIVYHAATRDEKLPRKPLPRPLQN